MIGGSPILLMIYIRFSMPESRLWIQYNELRKSGMLPVEKKRARNPLIEIFKGASRRYTLLGIAMVSGYMFAYYSVSIFMPRLMTAAGATPALLQSLITIVACTIALMYVLNGYLSDKMGRKAAVAIPATLSVIGFVGIFYAAKTPFAGSLLFWPLFGWYMLWGIGQTAAGIFGPWFAELFPVESRSSAVSSIYMIGRGVGSIAPFAVPAIVPMVGGELSAAMMIGLPAAVLAAIAALCLPETAGRVFAVVESKERSTEIPVQGAALARVENV